MNYKHNVAPGQVYDFYSNGVKTYRVTIDLLAEVGARGEEMWKFVDSRGNINVAHYIEVGAMRLYSQNSLNG